MDRNRGSVADRYTLNLIESNNAYKHPLPSRFLDDTPINHYRGVFSGDLRRYDSRCSEFDVSISTQSRFNLDYDVSGARQFTSYDQRAVSPKGRLGGGSFETRNFDDINQFVGGSFAKLYVGSIPKTATEEDIRPLFEEHGGVVEVALIKDKRIGQQQGNTPLTSAGCCFIKYTKSEEADRAICYLHNPYMLPGEWVPSRSGMLMGSVNG